jgi:hypothetical protein
MTSESLEFCKLSLGRSDNSETGVSQQGMINALNGNTPVTEWSKTSPQKAVRFETCLYWKALQIFRIV